MNQRTRMDPPSPENYFGNIIGSARITPCMKDVKEGRCHALVMQIREAIEKIDGDYVNKH